MKRAVFAFLIVFVMISVSLFEFSASAADIQSPSTKVIAYYLHGAMRCPTCHKLEQYSKEAIESNFKDALASGKLEFKVVNWEDKGNEHYARDYQLYTKSLILSLVRHAKETKWKNLDKIWEYVGNQQRFSDYVKNEVADLLKEAQ